MGRTISSFRIATVLEGKEWDNFRKYLNINNSNKNHDKKIFKEMFSIANLYNSACSNTSYYDVNNITSLQDVKRANF
jgi:hypothetical protein